MTTHSVGRHARRLGAGAAIIAASAALSLGGGMTAASAAPAVPPSIAPHALAPHAPFTCDPGKVVLALTPGGGRNTQLYNGTFGPGTIDFSPIGTPTDIWNSTGYNPRNGYFYGVTDASMLLQIGADGSVTHVGNLTQAIGNTNLGAFDDSGYFWVGQNGAHTLYRINATTLDVTPLELSQGMSAPDITFANGYMWGLSQSAVPNLLRIDLTSGQVSTFLVGNLPDGVGDTIGGAFTYGNGDLGFYTQDSSTLLRIKVSNPFSATPTATVISTQTGPASGSADAASCFTSRSDLSVTVDAPAGVPPNTSIDYTLTVRNNGPSGSSGWTVTDELPDNLSNATTSTPGCSIKAGVLSCTGGALRAGDDVVVQFTATGPGAGTVLNSATVSGNEADPNPANDTDSATTEIAATPGSPMINLQVGGGVLGGLAVLALLGALVVRRRRSEVR